MALSLDLKAAQKWNKLASAWSMAAPPATPSADDLASLASILNQIGHRSANLALLGATPATRQLIWRSYRHKAKLSIFDVSRGMMDASARSFRPRSHETFVRSEWTALGERFPKKFDLITGDKVLDNVPMSSWSIFERSLFAALKKHGYFVTRVGLQNKRFMNFDLRAALIYWTGQLASGFQTETSLSGFWEELLGASGFAGGVRHRRQSVAAFRPTLLSLRDDKTLPDLERDFLANFLKRYDETLDFSWTSYDLADVTSLMSKRFFLRRIATSSDYKSAPLQPTLVFQRRE